MKSGVSKVRRFEDLFAWQKARQLTCEIYRVTRQGGFTGDIGVVRQMQRASVSVMSNIAEGLERANPGDFHRFLMIAKGSCGEVRAQLYVALDVGYLPKDRFQTLLAQTEETARVISGLVASVASQRC